LRLAFGVAPPSRPLSSESEGERAALWLGPDEWLLIAEEGAEGLEAAIGAALPDVFFSLVDVSHRQTVIELEGARAADALNFGVALDLDERAFPVGMVVRTLFLKAEITLWRRGLAHWRVEVARSFAAYLAEALGAAIAGLT
jgi:sarcosine oxidase subunit gamma